MKTFLIRGIPMAVQRDGWWLNGTVPRVPGPAARQGIGPSGGLALLLLGLIALADVLVWQVVPGLALAVFGAVLVLAALWAAGRRIDVQRQALVAGVSLLALLPLVELVQPLSLLIAVCGVSAMLAVLAGLRPEDLLRGALRLWPLGAWQTVQDAAGLLHAGDARRLGGAAERGMMRWFLPLSLGLVFALLLLDANPVVRHWIGAIPRFHLSLPGIHRMLFWLCLLPLVWTALSVTRLRERMRAARALAPRSGPHRNGLINPGSVTRALLLFNAVFALQTVTDVMYLYGGVRLPDGISYAQYAHRGAYPLVLTALLAGGFALLTRRWILADRVLRALMMLWVAQNVALVASALVRLDLYVGVYGLTHLRLAAAVWMGMVAGGLALILWQVWRGHGNGWLVWRGGAMAFAVLYLCAFVSFDAVIARHNLNTAPRPDHYYLCGLGEAALPVILAHQLAGAPAPCGPDLPAVQVPQDWREWGFRNWRVRNSLRALTAEATQ